MKVPKNKFLKVTNYMLNLRLSRLLLSFMHNGYLLEIGWFDSWKQNKCIDEDGHPIPWSPYPFINFMKDYLKKKMIVFEYGSGYSTLFFSRYVKHVYSVEHDLRWISKIESHNLLNITIIQSELTEMYENTIHGIQNKFDIIFIDGRRRIKCIRESIDKIKSDGIIILDDSDRDEYREGIELLNQQGFRSINFYGISPLAFINRKTTIFFQKL